MTSLIKIISPGFLILFLLSACGGGSDGGGGSDKCGTVVDISPNGMLQGKLEDGDCRLGDIVTGGDQSFVDEYRVTLPATGTLIIEMRSATMDSLLVLLDRSASCISNCDTAILISADDDGGGGLDSRIVVDLAAGSYLILANTILPESGNYTIETSF